MVGGVGPPVLITTNRVSAIFLRMAAATDWEDWELVFAPTRGTALDSRNLTRSVRGILERAGLPRIRFHDLRHTAATLLLAQDVADQLDDEDLQPRAPGSGGGRGRQDGRDSQWSSMRPNPNASARPARPSALGAVPRSAVPSSDLARQLRRGPRRTASAACVRQHPW